jgi:hypothetical protein
MRVHLWIRKRRRTGRRVRESREKKKERRGKERDKAAETK